MKKLFVFGVLFLAVLALSVLFGLLGAMFVLIGAVAARGAPLTLLEPGREFPRAAPLSSFAGLPRRNRSIPPVKRSSRA